MDEDILKTDYRIDGTSVTRDKYITAMSECLQMDIPSKGIAYTINKNLKIRNEGIILCGHVFGILGADKK